MTYYKKSRFKTKKPIRSFRDLQVYQTALQGSILIIKDVFPKIDSYPFKDRLINSCLAIPQIIAEAHSARFESNQAGIILLEKAMNLSNKMIVYLEQIQEIYLEEIDNILIQELIRRYVNNRRKILNLSRSWQKFMEKDKQ